MGFGSKLMWGSGLLSFSTVLFLTPAHAFGPSKPKPPAGPSYTLPNPVRHVIVRPFQNVHAFEIPNQVTTTVDDAQNILTTDLQGAATSNGLHVVQGGDISDLDPCGKHLEIWPAVTDFTMDAMSANLQFGFNSTGSINIGQPSAVAQDTITVGHVAFVLFLYECDNAPNGSCQSLVRANTDQTVLGNHLQFTIQYQQITGGADIFNKTDLGKDVIAILNNGVKTLVSDPSMAQVPWSTTVAAVGSDGSITMLAGSFDNIAKDQYFTVYARANASSQCGVFEALDCAATTEIDGPSSIATVYRKLAAGASRAIQPGDVVYVGSPSCALN